MSESEREREQNVYIAKITEQAERYDEMLVAIKKVATLEDVQLTVEERHLLSVAYKNIIGPRRSSWRILSSIEQKEISKGNDAHVQCIKIYYSRVVRELNDIVTDVIQVIDTHLLPNAIHYDAKVFYYKMKADYYRYQTEFTVDAERVTAVQKCSEAYTKAQELRECLLPTDPVRLGLALNLSVFYSDILRDYEKSSQVAKEAFDAGVRDLETLSEDSYRDTTVVLQLLRDNLTMFGMEEKDEEEGAE